MNLLAIGIIEKVHGLKGYLRVRSFSGETRHFMKLSAVRLHSKTVDGDWDIEKILPAGRSLLMKLKGIDSIDQARPLVRAELLVDRSLAAPLRRGEYYLADLCQCEVLVGTTSVGKIRSIWDGAQAALLEVELQGGAIRIIPFVREHVGTVDLASRSVELKSPWLLE